MTKHLLQCLLFVCVLPLECKRHRAGIPVLFTVVSQLGRTAHQRGHSSDTGSVLTKPVLKERMEFTVSPCEV